MAGKRNREKVKANKEAKKEKKVRVPKEKCDCYTVAPVHAVNDKQREFLKALKTHQVIVFIAPAGVGKSFVGMSEVCDWYKKGVVDKIILSRPAVGMGNTLGLLKGDLVTKYTPYLMSLIEVIKNRYGVGFYENSLNSGAIEMIPLEYMRGRNISECAIVDECQNMLPSEMYTMITRVAEDGKLILLGDDTQNDIRGVNALQWLPKFLESNPELKEHIKLIEATSDDIVRSGLCKLMVKAKERSGSKF